jgi:hypothetical protein
MSRPVSFPPPLAIASLKVGRPVRPGLPPRAWTPVPNINSAYSLLGANDLGLSGNGMPSLAIGCQKR